MITNKDISIDSENGKITLNGNKYDLGTQGEIDAVVKDVYSVMGQNGAKNLISYPYYTPDVYTTNGITFTVNEDRSVTATGTATANAQYSLHSRAIGSNNELRVKNGDYIISDGGLQNVNTEIQLGVTKNGVYQQLVFTRNGEAEFTINGDDYAEDSANLQITLVVRTGATTPVTFKPMLRLASDTDDTYEPYAMTNKQLTDQVEEVGTQIENLIKYKEVTLNTSTNGYEAPSATAGGVSIEALASYEALGVSRDKILGIIPIDWSSISQPLSFYLGGTSVKAMLHGSTSIYANSSLSYVKVRVVYHS